MDPMIPQRPVGPAAPSEPTRPAKASSEPDRPFEIGQAAPTDIPAPDLAPDAARLVELVRLHAPDASSREDLVSKVVSSELREAFADRATPEMVDHVTRMMLNDPTLRVMFSRVVEAAGVTPPRSE